MCALALASACGLDAQSTAAWTAVGPGAVSTAEFGKITGRISAVAFDPNDASGNTVYVSATGGGVWKSANAAGSLGGVTFTPLTDNLPVFAATANGSAAPSLTIGALAVQPVANPVVIAGTGDPNNATDSLYGVGLLRSADSGLTWTLATGSNDGVNGKHSFMGLSTAGIAWSTVSSGVVVAAMTSSPQANVVGAVTSSSVAGLYYSTDAGVTWRMATVMDGSQIVQQPLLSAQPGNPATAVVWDGGRGSFYAAVRFHGVYSSTDGVTWTRLSAQPGAGLTTANCPANAGGIGSTGCPMFRGALAVQPATGDLYALTVDANSGDQGLWQDLCSATSSGACATKAPVWGARVDVGALDTSGAIPQGGYDLALTAVPATGGGTQLLAGAVDVYRCSLTTASPSSCAWRNATNASNGCANPAGVAGAQHALAGVAFTSGGPLVLIGNDGGLWRSTDGIAETGAACSAGDAGHFDNLNGVLGAAGSLTEVVGVAAAPSDTGSLMAGLGANGTALTGAAATNNVWPQVSIGEGGLPLIDPNAPANWFATVGAGVNLKFCAKGPGCAASDFAGTATIGSTQVGGDAALLHAPMMLDPALTSSLIVGTCRVWRGVAADGTTWTAANALSPAMDGLGVPCSASSALIKSVAAGGPVVSSAQLPHAGSSVMYAGMAGLLDGGGTNVGGHVFVTKAANTATGTVAWTDVAKSPVTNLSGSTFNPDGYDVFVALDSHDATGGTVYAAVAGFGGDVVVPHLYRSVDFGVHWLNISGNLPGVPANAVVVDPNDANTVYVATDAGVYATRAIATCGTMSCWSVMGTGLPNAPAVALAAGANLPTGDGRLGMLRVGTYGRGVWQTPLLAAVTQAQPAVVLSANSLTFAPQQQSTQSTAQTVTVTSSGNAAVVFGKLVVSGDYTETDTCAGQTVAVGSSCSVSVSFAPTTTGTRPGLLTIYANVSGGQATVSLTGTGTAPASVVITPPAVTFGATTVGQTSAAIGVSVANTGGTAATINSITANGDFAVISSACGTTLLPQNACQVNVVFAPTASGTRTGTLAVVDSAGTQTAPLTGVGQAPPTDTLSPASLSFAQQAIGTTSATQTVMLANAGDQALTLVGASVSGDFSAVNGCGAIVAAHTTCAVSVQFVPTATGTRAGLLTVSDAYRTQTVPLTGVGVAPAGVSLTPVMLSFSATGVGLVSSVQTVTLTNNGGLPLTVSGVSVSSGFVLVANGCGSTVAAGTACALQVAFAPVAAGAAMGSLVLMDSVGSQTVSLTGAGVDFSLAANGPTSVTVASGVTATFPMLLTSASGLSGNVALACAGAPAHSVCTVSPNVAALGTTVSVTVTVQTGTARLSLPWFWAGSGVVLALVLPIGIRRRRAAGLFVGSLMLVGCGTARIIPGATGGAASTPTASGTYALTVSATGAGVTHSVPLTLVVQ